MMPISVNKIPSYGVFNEGVVEAYTKGAQNYRKGQLTVACGDVSNVRMEQNSLKFDFLVTVHSEMTANQNYDVGVKFDNSAPQGVRCECSCAARLHEHHRCKHQAAALLILVALKNYPNNANKPKWAHRPGVNNRRFESADIRAAVRADMTWEDVLQRAQSATERHNGITLAQRINYALNY